MAQEPMSSFSEIKQLISMNRVEMRSILIIETRNPKQLMYLINQILKYYLFRQPLLWYGCQPQIVTKLDILNQLTKLTLSCLKLCLRINNEYIFLIIDYLTLVPQAMASLGHAPLGREGGRGIRQTHWPAASNSGASKEKIFVILRKNICHLGKKMCHLERNSL